MYFWYLTCSLRHGWKTYKHSQYWHIHNVMLWTCSQSLQWCVELHTGQLRVLRSQSFYFVTLSDTLSEINSCSCVFPSFQVSKWVKFSNWHKHGAFPQWYSSRFFYPFICCGVCKGFIIISHITDYTLIVWYFQSFFDPSWTNERPLSFLMGRNRIWTIDAGKPH